MALWFAIGLPAYLAVCATAAVAMFPPKSDQEQADEDAEQMQALASYRQAYIAKQHADLRRDTRAKHVAAEALTEALHAQLRSEVKRA